MNDALLAYLRTEYLPATYPVDEYGLGDLLAKFVTDNEAGSWQRVLIPAYCPDNMDALK